MSESRELPPNLVIRRLSPNDSLVELTALLHRAYKRLLDMGLHYTATVQTEEVTRRRVSTGETWVAAVGSRVVATVTLRITAPEDDAAWYRRSEVANFQQFAVEPELQGCGVGGLLMGVIEERARQLGASELACDTAENAAHLIAYYARRSYREVGIEDWRPKVNYRSVILSKQL